jgi:acyl carrier protein
VLESLPITPNGKVDRRALPAPDATGPAVDDRSTFVRPRNDLEEAVARIWSEVLGIDRIGVHDNFFDLGGHSLKATRVISRLRESFRIELRMRSLFERPTVAGLSDALLEQLLEQDLHRSGAAS